MAQEPTQAEQGRLLRTLNEALREQGVAGLTVSVSVDPDRKMVVLQLSEPSTWIGFRLDQLPLIMAALLDAQRTLERGLLGGQ